jgi:phosphoribosyl 1,2-cyclic phosphodiesterase
MSPARTGAGTVRAANGRLRFAILGSGSSGNAALIECGDTRILLDCGFSARETVARLNRVGREPAGLTAILLTHEHSDHVNGVAASARRFGVPVWMTRGTRAALGKEATALAEARCFNPHQSFAIGDIEVQPFPVPHDAREPAQFVFSNGAARLGYLTDIGMSTPHVETSLSGCQALVLECNHDPGMLEASEYPASLKARIRGEHGHLANETAAQILGRLDTSSLQHIVAAHLSRKNNTPALARAALSNTLGCARRDIDVADQDAGLGWRELSNGLT